jgi:polar amino acid transport system substrate-binding protein
MKTWPLYLKQKSGKTKPIYRSKLFIFLLILILGLTVGIFRSCSNIATNNPVYRIARDGSWSKLLPSEKGVNLLAFSNDLLFTIAKKADIQFELIFINPSNLFPGLDQEQYDGILSGYAAIPSSRDWYIFSNPIYLSGPVLIVQSSENIHSLAEMKGKIIGILTGSSTVFNVEQHPDILITSFDTPLQALSALEKNTIDGVILPLIQAYIYTTGLYEGKLKIATEPLTNDGVRLIALKNDRGTHFIELFNKGLKEVKEDGTFDELLKKWGLFTKDEKGKLSIIKLIQ